MFICGFFLTVAAPARADDTHYQNQLIGERALGMGGAFTAVASDPTASFYNPGGLATTPSSSVSASLNLYGVEHRVVKGGLLSYISGEPATADLEATAYPTIPTTFGVLRTFGEQFPDGTRRHALAFSMLIPDQTSYAYDATVGTSGETDLDVFHLSETDRTLWIGPSYAVRITPDLAVGVSAFVAMRNWSRSYSHSQETPTLPPVVPPTSDYFWLERVDTSFDSFELLFRLGALWQPLPDFRVGLTIGFPSLHVWGDGSLSSQFTYAWFDPPPAYGDVRFESVSGLPAESFSPLEVRTGLAWIPSPELLIALDISYHLPTLHPYERVHLWQEDRARLQFDDLFTSAVTRREVININAGFEWLIAGKWPVRAGVFTNLSSAPDLSASAAGLERVDILGGTLSVGYQFASFTLNFGFLGSAGWGKAQAYDLRGGTLAYVERDARYELFYFFLSGAQRIVTQTLETWIEAAPEESGTAAPIPAEPPMSDVPPAPPPADG
jgi:long-chain fatty acid transport protein